MYTCLYCKQSVSNLLLTSACLNRSCLSFSIVLVLLLLFSISFSIFVVALVVVLVLLVLLLAFKLIWLFKLLLSASVGVRKVWTRNV